METKTIRRIILYTIVWVLLYFNFSQAGIRELYYKATHKTQTYVQFSPNPNQLKLGTTASPLSSQEIILNEPIELDFKTRAQIMHIRKEYVDKYRDLLVNDYLPFEPLYNQIEDNRPWWGIRGEFCWSRGQKSIDGPSEETRFFINPYLLLGLDEGVAFTSYPCAPVYPHPVSFFWFAQDSKAEVTYDISRFFREREYMPRKLRDYHTLSLISYNARDFGYEYISVAPEESLNVAPVGEGRLFKEACQLRAFIHRGISCGYPNGCNNQSPDEPDLQFKILDVPAVLYCKLWKANPKQASDNADFTFVIKLK
ncbi:MAG: hypothetical protein PHQ96_09375 [Candidatus Omnitrophica bacterium]|nr:hypothetical protein [Candidatus Omnitrophota bacterium]